MTSSGKCETISILRSFFFLPLTLRACLMKSKNRIRVGGISALFGNCQQMSIVENVCRPYFGMVIPTLDNVYNTLRSIITFSFR